MSNQLRSCYDIIINGGGIVGFTLLNLIQKSPHLSRTRVLLIEQAKKPSNFEQPPRNPEIETDSDGQNEVVNKFSNRVSSITLASKTVFKNLGLWNTVKPFGKDIKNIKVWNYDYSDKIIFHQNSSSSFKYREESDVIFTTLENNRLSSALLKNIHQDPKSGELIAWNSKLQNLDGSGQNGTIDLKIENSETGEERTVSAKLVLGCDGYRSKVRELSQIKYRECDLKKMAVVGTVKMNQNNSSNSNNDVAYQKFSSEKDTVAALLPLNKNFSSFVISAPIDYAKFLNDCEEETFTQEFNRLLTSNESPANPLLRGAHEIANSAYDSLHSLLQFLPAPFRPSIIQDIGLDEPPYLDYVVSGSRASFPLLFGTTSPRMLATITGQPRIALLGDAAHRVHPLAGQGLNLGIQDAAELVRQLELISRTGERVFDDDSMLVKVLKRYELKRQAYVIPMSAGILVMQDLFKLAPARMLSSLNKCDPIKRVSVRVANGCVQI